MSRFVSKVPVLMLAEVLMVVLVSVSVLKLVESRTAYIDSAANERLVDRLKQEIVQLRSMESIADEGSSGDSLSNSDVVQIAVEAGVAENQVQGIQRMSPIEISNTDYQQLDIAVDFRSITLRQLILFCLGLESAQEAMKVTQISLRNVVSGGNTLRTTGASAEERWNAELILTQVVFTATRASR